MGRPIFQTYAEEGEEMRVYTFDIDLESVDISDIHRHFRTDLSGFGMEDFHCGMPDLEYDKFVPSNFGREDD